MANLFIPFEIRNKLEEKRRELERRVNGTYTGPDRDHVRMHQQVDQDLLDIIEMINLILVTAGIEDQRP